nr:hypothetical protein [Tanacetum cinerariifolium]
MLLAAAPLPADTTATSSSTTIDQNVPYASTSSTYQEIKSQVIHQGVKEQIHGHHNAQFDNAPILHNLSSDPSAEETTLQGVIPSNLHHLNQSFDTVAKLTKNHPLENVISNPSRSLITPRDVANVGLNMACRVTDLVANGVWTWPQAWLMKAPNIDTIPALILVPHMNDTVQ